MISCRTLAVCCRFLLVLSRLSSNSIEHSRTRPSESYYMLELMLKPCPRTQPDSSLYSPRELREIFLSSSVSRLLHQDCFHTLEVKTARFNPWKLIHWVSSLTYSDETFQVLIWSMNSSSAGQSSHLLPWPPLPWRKHGNVPHCQHASVPWPGAVFCRYR